MRIDIERKRIVIINNINFINRCLKELSEPEQHRLYKKLDDVFYFYGMNKEQVLMLLKIENIDVLDFNGNYAEIEGVTNAMIFHLKYKNPIASKKEDVSESG